MRRRVNRSFLEGRSGSSPRQRHPEGGGATQATARVPAPSSAAFASFFCSKGFWNVAFGPSWEARSMSLFPSRSGSREKAETSWRSWNTHLEVDQTSENHIRHTISWGIFYLLGKRAFTGNDSSTKMSQAWCQAPSTRSVLF